jgi:sigma-B regulation protein RsbU (phosphoserine phosphatase)
LAETTPDVQPSAAPAPGVPEQAGLLDELSRKNAALSEMAVRLEAMARRMSDELRLAANIQRCLLPPPVHDPRLELAWEFLPFRELGGDYFDLVPLSAGRFALAIGDVMGKGVSAALLSSNLKACLRANLQGGQIPAEEMVSRVNRLFHEVTPKGLFASLFFGVLDVEAGLLEYANAGHDYPFVVSPSGAIRDLTEGGTVLGLLPDSRYERGTVAVAPRDLLVFYSDGVTDRMNCSGEPFGLPRLKEAAARALRDPARIALYMLLGEVQAWSAGPPEDDLTLVVARRH